MEYGYVRVSTREQNEQRQAEGIRAAKDKGIHLGRPSQPLPVNFSGVYQRWKIGEITGAAAARECNMPLATFRYRAKLYQNQP